MNWLAWLVLSLGFLAVGGQLMRRGRTGIVTVYAAACVVLFLLTLFRFGHLFGDAFAPWPWILCTAVFPATLILAIVAVRRDREAVMGAPGSREAATTAAVVYGAGATHDSGGVDASGGGEM